MTRQPSQSSLISAPVRHAFHSLFSRAAIAVLISCSSTAALADSSSIALDAHAWRVCADEYGHCTFSGTREVRYGTTTQNTAKTLTDGTGCDNGVFGDPAPGANKQCWIQIAATSAANSAPGKATATTTAATNVANVTTAGTTATIRCEDTAASTNAPAAGAPLEADTPGSDGTRLFKRNQAFTIVITTRATQDDNLSWQLRDNWDRVRAAGKFAVAPGARQTTLRCSSALAGYFALSASLAKSGDALPARGTRPAGIATFGVLPDFAGVLPPPRFVHADQHRFGGQGTAFIAPGQHCCDGDGYRPLYTDLGLAWANDNRNWYMEEPERANTFSAASKQLVPYFRKGDILRLIQLDGIPGWASPTGKETHSYAPKSTDAMKDFMTRVGAESAKVRANYFPTQEHNYYQVTWEPDADGGLPWKDTDANFVAMYGATWQGIHASDPSAVIMGLTYSSVTGNIEWLKRLAPLGIARYLDGLSVHGYYDIGTSPSHPPERLVDNADPALAARALPQSMRTLRSLMAAMLKPGAKLFVTETGISYDIGSNYGPHYPGANVLFAQGAVVARTHLILLGEGADTSFVFYATDTPDSTPGYGLFFDLAHAQGGFGTTDISPKPAALAVATLTRVIDDTVTLGPLRQLPRGVFGYAFERRGGGPVITALWTYDSARWNASSGFDSSDTTNFTLPVDAPGTSGNVTVLDMMGNPASVAYRDGKLALRLGAAPVYVVSSNAALVRANVIKPVGYE